MVTWAPVLVDAWALAIFIESFSALACFRSTFVGKDALPDFLLDDFRCFLVAVFCYCSGSCASISDGLSISLSSFLVKPMPQYCLGEKVCWDKLVGFRTFTVGITPSGYIGLVT